MKLDPQKPEFARLTSLLKRLADLSAKANPKADRNWAAETAKTLAASKLEDFDLAEYVSETFNADLAPRDNKRPVWDYSRALLALINEMEAGGLRSPKVKSVRYALQSWSQDA